MVSPDSPLSKWSRRPPPPVKTKTGAWFWLLAAGCILALGFGAYRFLTPPPTPVSAEVTAPSYLVPTAAGTWRMVSLFYPLADGSGLSSIIQKRPACQSDSACLEDLLVALSENPGAGLFPLLPQQGGSPSISIDGATATINFRRETIQHLPGGVQNERLVLAALIGTLTVNFPMVQQLAIEIDGIPAETLKGHVDLTTPFVADFSLVRRPLLPSFPIKAGSIY